ncbi:MAG: gamma-glutamyl-gamma-aminobutyrate hydrolase family protein [Chlorobiota bacterium]|jgi:putative glutamine amidotransferase|nr:MAG: gamma-glutamyl-gamma-aminobutyrate hydrolase family protein [Chlorobiota bacterium]
MIIGISKGSGHPKYKNYSNWISKDRADVMTIDLSESENKFENLKFIDGLILTGGPDVNPNLYESPDLMDKCDLVDMMRDDFEYKLIEFAEENNIPILGICRGLQILNVYYGGSLIPHIPEVVSENIHSKNNNQDNYHQIEIQPGTLLYKTINEFSGEVNSAHHQSVNKLANGFIASAKSNDGIVEAIEKLDPNSKPYLLAVQWHPERMINQESSFTKNIKNRFLLEVESKIIFNS